MNKTSVVLHKNLVGNQKFSLLLMRRAQLRGYYIKHLQIDSLLHPNFKKIHTNRTMRRNLKFLKSISIIKTSPKHQELVILAHFISHQTGIKTMRFDLTSKKQSIDQISNQTMLEILIERVIKKGYNKNVKTLLLDLYEDQIKQNLDYRLCRSISGFYKLEKIKLNFNGKDYKVSDKAMVRFMECILKFKNMVGLPFHINRLEDQVCQIVMKNLYKVTGLRKVHLEGIINEKIPKALDFLMKALASTKLERFSISLHDYSESRDTSQVLISLENTLMSLNSLVHLTLKLDFSISENGFLRILGSLEQARSLSFLGLSTLCSNISPQMCAFMGDIFSKKSLTLKGISLTVVGGEPSPAKKTLEILGTSVSQLESLESMKLEFSKSKRLNLVSFFSAIPEMKCLKKFKLTGFDDPLTIVSFARRQPKLNSFKMDIKSDPKTVKNESIREVLVTVKNDTMKKFIWSIDTTQEPEFIVSAFKNYEYLEKIDLRNRYITITPESWRKILTAMSRVKKLEKFLMMATFKDFGEDIEKALSKAGFVKRLRHILIIAFTEKSQQPIRFEVEDHDLWLY